MTPEAATLPPTMALVASPLGASAHATTGSMRATQSAKAFASAADRLSVVATMV